MMLPLFLRYIVLLSVFSFDDHDDGESLALPRRYSLTKT